MVRRGSEDETVEAGNSPAFRISTDRSELDLELIHRYLAFESYWAQGIARSVIETAVKNSLCFGGYLGEKQVAFARVVTDHATFAHLKDVFVVVTSRDKGYGVELMRAVIAYPTLRDVAFTLGTKDAHGLYQRFGFRALPEPERSMIRVGTFLPAPA